MSDVRTVQRDMRRVARILNEVFGVQAHTMSWDVLEEPPRLCDGVFEVRSRCCSKPLQDEPMFLSGISESTKKTTVSLNKCRQAVLWNTGWLSHFVRDLGFDTTERHLENPKPTHPFTIYESEGTTIFSKDYEHTILLFRPGGSSGGDSGGIVVDPSHAQYQFEHGIDTINNYMSTKVSPAELSDPFESSYEDEPFRDTLMEEMAKDNDPQWPQDMNAAIIGVTKNTIITEVEQLEGVSALLGLSDQSFEAALQSMVASLNLKLGELRQKLEVVLYNSDREIDSFKFFWEILTGEGHRLCRESLEPVVSQLETLPKY